MAVGVEASKTLLTHAYFLGEDAREQKIMRPYPPLGILCIAAYLAQHGTPATVFDTTFSTRQALEREILRSRPDVLGVYTNLMTRPSVLALVRFVRAQPSLRGTRIVLGGPEVTHHADKLLAHGADVIVIGEGEVTMHELLAAWSRAPGDPDAIAHVAGIAFRGRDGAVTRTAPRTLLPSLDLLPMPARGAIDLRPYLDAWRAHHGKSALSVSTMRGCPYTCRWCSRAVYGKSYRRRSPQLVADEIESLIERYDPDSLWFVDDVFTINHRWLEEFTLEVERRGVRLPYECITRADRLDGRSVALLRRSGCFRVWIGAESGSQRVLDAMDRRVGVDRVREMIHLSKSHGIEAGTFIMLGYPGETIDDIEATIEHLKCADPDQFTITVAYPIKGTPFYEDVREAMTEPLPWERSTDRDTRIRRPYSDRFYRFAVDRVIHEVRGHKLSSRSGAGAAARATLHRARALVARAGMRADPALQWLEARARGLRGTPSS
jgi:anaerobic magnesium-protoporphyrin IX monomethyl ester cyclase